jgi:hypothetical protein
MRATTDCKLLRTADIDRMNNVSEDIRLTADQLQFAHEHRAAAEVYCADRRTVCVYSERPNETVRWIVDDHGRVLERYAFIRDRAA